jgi:hypothetical protein
MNQRGLQLADEVRKAGVKFSEYVATVPDASWHVPVEGDERSVGLVAYHLVEAVEVTTDVLDGVRTDGSARPLTSDEIDSLNAEHARAHSDCTRSEVVSELRRSWERLATLIESMTDQQLDTGPAMIYDVPLTSVQQLVELAIVAHSTVHLGEIRAALAAQHSPTAGSGLAAT